MYIPYVRTVYFVLLFGYNIYFSIPFIVTIYVKVRISSLFHEAHFTHSGILLEYNKIKLLRSTHVLQFIYVWI